MFMQTNFPPGHPFQVSLLRKMVICKQTEIYRFPLTFSKNSLFRKNEFLKNTLIFLQEA